MNSRSGQDREQLFQTIGDNLDGNGRKYQTKHTVQNIQSYLTKQPADLLGIMQYKPQDQANQHDAQQDNHAVIGCF